MDCELVRFFINSPVTVTLHITFGSHMCPCTVCTQAFSDFLFGDNWPHICSLRSSWHWTAFQEMKMNNVILDPFGSLGKKTFMLYSQFNKWLIPLWFCKVSLPVVLQVCTHCSRNFGPLLHTHLFKICQVSGLSLSNTEFQLPPKTFFCI